jgi:hypothetical protein
MAFFDGAGDMTDFVKEWDMLFVAFNNQIVIQNQSMSGIASMGLRADSWEIELGG